MPELNWAQVRAWRLRQHHLDRRAGATSLVKVVKDLGGVQAQVLSAAELALWNRVAGVRRRSVDDALWKKKSLVKIWAMRGTLHLMPADELPMWCAAASTKQLYWHPSWLSYQGVGAPELQAIMDAVPEALDGKRLTREQLADAVSRITKRAHLAKLLRQGWGSLLKPSAFAGHLCFGPNEGANVTFVRPDQWVPRWKAMEIETALKEVTRRYLRAYGPAKREELAGWWGIRGAQARQMLAGLGDEIEEVQVEGWQGWMLRGDPKRAAALPPVESVRLLGNFDPLTLLSAKYAGYDLKPEHKVQVYRKAGWVSPVLLVDGIIGGVWAVDKSGGTVQVVPFKPPTARVKVAIAEQAAALGHYLGRDLRVAYVRAITPGVPATP